MNVHTITENDRPSTALLHAVAEHTSTPVLELQPLADVIDPEALDSLVQHGSDVRLAFDYHDLTVTVESDRVRIE